jgi:uncharacterized membrane protein
VLHFSNAGLDSGPEQRTRRLVAIDIARGAAVAAMVVYHFAWNLSELRLIETEITQEPEWRFFARAIAASFLTLVGIGLVLAHPNRIRWRAFGKRLAVVAGAAFLITIATYFTFPASYIFFGILHAIALASLLAVPFTQLPAWMSGLVAVLIGVATLLLKQPAFDLPILAFLGLGSRVPTTNDWVPVFPWAAFVFAGVALAKLGRRWLARAPDGPASGLGSPLAWVGRHSLVIYLVHQPILFGALWGVVQVTGPNPAAVAAPFGRACLASCAETGAGEGICRATCGCTVEELQRAPVWTSVLAGRLTPDENAQVSQIARSCFSRSRATEPAGPSP